MPKHFGRIEPSGWRHRLHARCDVPPTNGRNESYLDPKRQASSGVEDLGQRCGAGPPVPARFRKMSLCGRTRSTAFYDLPRRNLRNARGHGGFQAQGGLRRSLNFPTVRAMKIYQDLRDAGELPLRLANTRSSER